MEKFILSWAFPVSILLVISFISFFIARKYMEKNKAKTLFAICLFISFALGLYIQNDSLSTTSSAAPDYSTARDRLGPITAVALLLCHPAQRCGVQGSESYG